MNKEKADCTVYIDESGDLGVHKGTKWFVISGVIVRKEHEADIRKIIDNIKRKLNVREIHLRKINDFFKRAYIVQELSVCNFIYMNILVDTDKFDLTKIPNPLVAYNFTCKYLLQRVSWYLKENDLTADIVLSARGTSRDKELIEYIKNKLIPFKGNMIKPYVFKNVEAKSAGEWDMLQLADVCATTMYLKHEKNNLGFKTPCFAKVLSEHLYRKGRKVLSNGIKYFTPDMKPSDEELQSDCVCIKKKELPARLPHNKYAGLTPSC